MREVMISIQPKWCNGNNHKGGDQMRRENLIEIAKEVILDSAEGFSDGYFSLSYKDLDDACEQIADNIIEKYPE